MVQRLFISAIRDKQIGQSTSKFTAYLPSSIHAKRAKILSISVENTAYSFSVYDNILWYYVDNTLYFIAIPVDRYIPFVQDQDGNDENDIVNILNNLFQGNNHDITVSFNDLNGRLTFKNNMSNVIRFVSSDEFEYDPSQFFNKANNRLGLVQNLIGKTIQQNQSITSEGILRLKRSSYFVSSSLSQFTSMLANQVLQYKSFPILARIPVSGDFGSVETYQSTAQEDMITLMGENISSVDVQILDEYMNEVNLHNGNVSIELILFDE